METHDLQAQANALATSGGTLELTKPSYTLATTLVLPQGVSLRMAPGTRVRAADDFTGESMVETAPYAREERRWGPQAIEGGILDGGGQPLIGIRTIRDRETDIRNITIHNCTRKGLHLGVEAGCETNCMNVRVQCEDGVVAEPDSIGIHYDKSTDNLVCMGTVIGYATGVRSDSSSNDFQQIHVWNYKENCRLVCCFACNGWNDSWNQCYADSPMNGDDEGYGFLVSRPFNRISNCRVYNNAWATPERVTGVMIEDGGTHGTYMGNHFTAREGHAIKAAFAGNLEAATILGNSYSPQVSGGLVSQLPSGAGGASPIPQLQFPGDQPPAL